MICQQVVICWGEMKETEQDLHEVLFIMLNKLILIFVL